MAEPLQRQAITGDISAGGQVVQAPTGGVFRPRGATAVASGNVARWASALDKFSAISGELAIREQAKQEKTDFVAGQTAQMAGKTFSELEKSGANKTTMQGFTTMQATVFNNKWFTERMEGIKNGTDAGTDPLEYGRNLQEQFKGVLTGNEFTDTVTTALAADSIPKLVQAQMTAHSRLNEERTYNGFRDSLVTASIANNGEYINDAVYGDGIASITGLTPERRRAAIVEAVTLSYENNSTTLPKLLGVHQYSRNVSESQTKMQAMPDASAQIIASLADPQIHGGKVTPELMMRIAATESGGNPSAVGPETTRGRGRAKGMFQFIDSTWKSYGEGDVFNPENSTKAAVKYMNELLDTFDGNEAYAVMAYIAGPGAVTRWINGGKKKGFDPHATNYVQKVLGVDVYEAPGKSLLGQGFTQTEMSTVLKKQQQWYNGEKERWSLNNAAKADKIILDQINGDISFEDAVSQVSALGMSESMTKSYHGMALSQAKAEVAEGRNFRTRAPQSLITAMDDYALNHFANGISMDTGAAEVVRQCKELGVRESEIEKVLSGYQSAYLKQTKIRGEEILTQEKTFSPEQIASLALNSANITDDPSTVTSAIEEMRRILGDRPEAVKREQEDAILKEYEKKVGAAVDEGRQIPLSLFSSAEIDKIMEWKNSYRTSTVDPEGNPAVTRANLMQDISTFGEMAGWNPSKMATVRGMLSRESLELDSAVFKQMLREQRRSAISQARQQTIMDAINSGQVHTLTGRDKEAAFDIVTARIDRDVAAQLNNDLGVGNWTPEQGVIASAESRADMLASFGHGVISDKYKSQFKSLMSQPSVDSEGNVDGGYLGLVHMYKRLYDTDPVLANKYAGDDAALLMQSVLDRDTMGLDFSGAVKQAWADQAKFRDVDRKRYEAHINSKEFAGVIAEMIPSAIENLKPSFFTRLFSSKYDSPSFTMSDENLTRLSSDPVLIRKVHDKAAYLKMRHPSSTDEHISGVAIGSVIGTMRSAHGDWISGSSLNQGDVLADFGVPENMRSDWALTDMLHKYLDAAIEADPGFDDTAFNLYRSESAKKVYGLGYTMMAQDSPSAVMNFRTSYDAGTRRLSVTFYDKDFNESSPVLIDGPLAAKMWMDDRIGSAASEAGIPTIKNNLRNALRDLQYAPEAAVATAENIAQRIQRVLPDSAEQTLRETFPGQIESIQEVNSRLGTNLTRSELELRKAFPGQVMTKDELAKSILGE